MVAWAGTGIEFQMSNCIKKTNIYTFFDFIDWKGHYPDVNGILLIIKMSSLFPNLMLILFFIISDSYCIFPYQLLYS